uniref:hypothetical protein n=1 Tax=uncultured Corynebacterium sp. TaxID=159447 RepID=UPI0025F5FCA1
TSRSIGLRHPTGSRNRVLSHPAHQHRAVKEAELNPGRFNISPQELNAATQYMVDELVSHGMSEAEAIEYLDELERKVIPDDFWESTN